MKNIRVTLAIIIFQLLIINSVFAQQIFLEGLRYSSVAWGDFDNDNYEDVLITGEDENGNKVSKIYKNMGDGNFIEQTQIELPGVINGSVAWGDYNKDNLFIDYPLMPRQIAIVTG